MKTVLITGGSRGIGAETARLFASRGYDVGIGWHNAEEQAIKLEKELTEQGCKAKLLRVDVADREQVFAMTKEFVRIFGQLDVLVCCAGIARQELFSDVTEGQWRQMMGANLDGTFYACQAAFPYMLSRKSGRIVTVSSIWGQVGASCEVAYSAAKAGVIGLTKALAKELGPSGITVNCVAPGVIRTDMNRSLPRETWEELRQETPLGRAGMPRDVAETVWFLASEAGRFFTGQVLAPNGGFVI